MTRNWLVCGEDSEMTTAIIIKELLECSHWDTYMYIVEINKQEL